MLIACQGSGHRYSLCCQSRVGEVVIGNIAAVPRTQSYPVCSLLQFCFPRIDIELPVGFVPCVMRYFSPLLSVLRSWSKLKSRTIAQVTQAPSSYLEFSGLFRSESLNLCYAIQAVEETWDEETCTENRFVLGFLL